MRRWMVLLLLSVAWVAAPRAEEAETVQDVLLRGTSPTDLRAQLLAYADRLKSADQRAAGEAYYHRGSSFERYALRDSAIDSYRRALELRGDIQDRMALADALLLRRQGEDVDEGLRVLRAGRSQAGSRGPMLRQAYLSRIGWALTLAGKPDSALAELGPLTETLSQQSLWRYRLARMYLGAADHRRAYPLLVRLAVDSRRQDREVMDLVKDLGERLGFARHLDGEIASAIAARERLEQRVIDRMGGRRLGFTATDGFDLGGVAVAPAGKGQMRAAVVLASPQDTLASYDSLAAVLTRAGFAVMLLDVRGSGWSVAPICPSPDTWTGREGLLQRLVAKDVPVALRELASIAPVDTTRYLMVGIGTTTAIAAQAAALDRRVEALLLLSPQVAAVDLGPTRARLALTQVPTYYVSGPADFIRVEETEALYQAGNRGASRVADARTMGSGPQLLRVGSAAERFIRWLDETLPGDGPHGPPPARSRKG